MKRPGQQWRYREADAAQGPVIEGAPIRVVSEGPERPGIPDDDLKVAPLLDGGQPITE